MTMLKLGQMAHCSQSFLSKVENGTITPSIVMLHRLARALAVRPGVLLGEDDHCSDRQADGRSLTDERGS